MRTSVALAAYDGEEYILDQLRSIKDQTLAVDEVVIVDDGSDDNTVKAVNRFLLEHSLTSWRLIVNPCNLGYAENFKKAIDLCSGDLIFLCDQDDIWVDNRVEVMTKVMETNPEINVLNTQSVSFQSGEVPTASRETRPEAMDTKKIDLNRRTFFIQYPGCVMCIRKTFYDQVRRYWRDGWAHDAFIWGMGVQNNSCYEIPFVSLLRRVHKGQTSGQVGHGKARRVQYLENMQKNSEALLQAARATNCPKKVERLYQRMMRTHKYRLELVRDKRYSRAVLLIPYLGCYHRARSYLVELKLALKGEP